MRAGQHRTALRAVAAETVGIVERGGYRSAGGSWVELTATVRGAVAGTRLHLPGEPLHPSGEPNRAPAVEVTNESTLAAARRLGPGTAGLVFASARNPGGGFRTGARAQEEDIARSSALHACLAVAPGFYHHHRRDPDLRYSDRVIYSPAVPVFRDDAGVLLDRPYELGMLTAAAPNLLAVAREQPDRVGTVAAAVHRCRWPPRTGTGDWCWAPGVAGSSATTPRWWPAPSAPPCTRLRTSTTSCSRCWTGLARLPPTGRSSTPCAPDGRRCAGSPRTATAGCPSRSAIEMHSVVDVLIRLALDEPVNLRLAMADVHQPVLVVPARVAGALGDCEPKVHPIPAHLARQEHEQPSRTTLARVSRQARQAIDHQRRALPDQGQVNVTGSLHAAAEHLVLALITGRLVGEHLVNQHVARRHRKGKCRWT